MYCCFIVVGKLIVDLKHVCGLTYNNPTHCYCIYLFLSKIYVLVNNVLVILETLPLNAAFTLEHDLLRSSRLANRSESCNFAGIWRLDTSWCDFMRSDTICYAKMRFGHDWSISGDTICVQDRHDHIRSDRSITIEFAIPLRSGAIITISVHDLLRHDTCRCVLIRASRTDALCCDVLRLLDGCFERFRSRLSHDETATGISTAWLIGDLIVDWTSEHSIPLMMAGLVDDENVTFALLMFAYITAIEEEEEQLQEPRPNYWNIWR